MAETADQQNQSSVSGSAAPPQRPAGESPAATAKSGTTEKVNVGEMTQEDPNVLEVDWGGGKGDDLLKGKTKQIPGNPPSSASSSRPSFSASTPANSEKFKFGIQVLVAVIDFILSKILAKIAGDGEKASQYKADPDGKATFEEALCMMLETKQDLMPTWLVVLLAFASAWGFQIMAAIELRTKKGKPGVEKKEASGDPMRPGLFIGTDGKVYRRYQNGNVRPAQFNMDGSEKIIGQPPKRRAA